MNQVACNVAPALATGCTIVVKPSEVAPFSAIVDDLHGIAARIRAGQTSINGSAGDILAPFGGYKMSGNGGEWGEFGFDEFDELKAVLGG